MLVSASRRTDIPAYFSEWFMNRLRRGFVQTKNPFNGKYKTIELSPQNVQGIVFWTKNASPIIKYLPEIDKMGYRYYFQYTITGYSSIVEPNAPGLETGLETFRALSRILGKERVIWRFDPILISNVSSFTERIQTFEHIAKTLRGYTNKVVISFMYMYKKTRKRSEILEPLDILRIYEMFHKSIIKEETHLQNPGAAPELEIIRQTNDFLSKLSKIARSNQFIPESCSQSIDMEPFNIARGACVDHEIINKAYNTQIITPKDKNQRACCGCVKSVDIGVYNTCLHGCLYCYANGGENSVKKNLERYTVNGASLTK